MKNRKAYKTEDAETNYWLSYSDMMAALLLTFVLVITFTMLQAKGQLEEKQNELEQTRIELDTKIKEKEEEIAKLHDKQAKLDIVLGVRKELIEALNNEFSNTDLKITIDSETGAIAFDSNILFDKNKYELKATGKSFLQEFLPRYLEVLFKPEYKDNISEIIIEGHTDTESDYLYNLRLSQNRALAVANFCLQKTDSSIKSDLQQIITANGRSYSNPKYIDGDVNKGVDMDASRRVEIKFRLKDMESITEILK